MKKAERKLVAMVSHADANAIGSPLISRQRLFKLMRQGRVTPDGIGYLSTEAVKQLQTR